MEKDLTRTEFLNEDGHGMSHAAAEGLACKECGKEFKNEYQYPTKCEECGGDGV